jgi:metal-dependent amidase/aminoacylase/carboxypeptidase family protein
MRCASCFLAAVLALLSPGGHAADIRADLDRLANQLEPKIIEWRHDIHRRIKLTAENIAPAGGATAVVSIEKPYAVTINDPAGRRREPT